MGRIKILEYIYGRILAPDEYWWLLRVSIRNVIIVNYIFQQSIERLTKLTKPRSSTSSSTTTWTTIIILVPFIILLWNRTDALLLISWQIIWLRTSNFWNFLFFCYTQNSPNSTSPVTNIPLKYCFTPYPDCSTVLFSTFSESSMFLKTICVPTVAL